MICERSSSGRAPPCQGGGSEFEPRRSLHASRLHLQPGFLHLSGKRKKKNSPVSHRRQGSRGKGSRCSGPLSPFLIGQKKYNGSDQQQDADDLRGGQAKQESAIGVAAQKFQEKPSDGVDAEIDGEQTPLVQPAAQQGKQYEEQRKAEQRFQKLNRETAHAVGDSNGILGVGETNGAFDSIAAAAQKAADPAKGVKQRHADRHHIHKIVGEPLFPIVQSARDHPAEKAAVKDGTAEYK